MHPLHGVREELPQGCTLIRSVTANMELLNGRPVDTSGRLAQLRDKYDLHMTVERFVSDEYEADRKFIRE